LTKVLSSDYRQGGYDRTFTPVIAICVFAGEEVDGDKRRDV